MADSQIAVDEELVKLIAESMPGWNTDADYESNRRWLEEHNKHRSVPPTPEEFEAALAQMNERLDDVNEAALGMARRYVIAIQPTLESRSAKLIEQRDE
jgi:hypothetical protein